MTRYTATIQHHSIARARVVDVGDDLASAKAAASSEFGDEQRDYTIIIMDHDAANFDSEIVARRKVSGRKWQDVV